MIIVCGNSVEEIKQNLHMVEMAVASSMPCGVGGATMADVAKAMQMMEHMGLPTAISNPNYDPDPAPWICPDCGEMSGYDAETDSCECCGRGYEDDEVDPIEDYPIPDIVHALLTTLADRLAE